MDVTTEARHRQEAIMTALHPHVLIDDVRDPGALAGRLTYVNIMTDTLAPNDAKMVIEKNINSHPLKQKYEREKYGKIIEPEWLYDYVTSPKSALPNELTKSADCKSIAKECAFTTRVIAALKYYQSLDMSNDKEKLVEFFHVKYKTILDDFIHILTSHNNDDDLDEIFNLLINENSMDKCNIMNCTLSMRHYRDRRNYGEQRTIINMEKERDNEEDEFSFYRDIMDQIHCYLYHLYDTALRVKKDDIKEDHLYDKQSYVDYTFLNICNVIKAKKKQLVDIVGIDSHRVNNNKFDMGIKNEGTFMDDLFEYIQSNKQFISAPIQEIMDLLHNEEYDSDAVENDVNMLLDEYKDSNISLQDPQLYEAFKNHLYLNKLYQYTFSIGYRMYYWNHYKQQQTASAPWHDNINDHGSHSINELCVKQKYHDLKDEILHNKILTLNRHQLNISIHKTNKYMETKKVKSSKATPDYGDQLLEHDRNDDLCYGIKVGTPITSNHVLSIVLYTDWSELSKELSATFRKTKSYHAISTVTQNNAEYANWSRLLRETVELFGVSWSGQYNPNYTSYENKIINRLKGPFFCGMSFVMVIPEFNIRLCGPTSTSKQIEVATRFGGDDGIIMQLNNIKDKNVFSDNVCAFPCFWLSNYSAEDEYLFCGGRHRVRIETIKILNANQSFPEFFSALYNFECIVNGSNVESFATEYQDQQHEVISNLMQRQLSKDKRFANNYPKYINNTFTAFLNHKKQIVISLDTTNGSEICSILSKLILYPLYPTYKVEMIHYKNIDKFSEPQQTDLFIPIMFELFSGINHIIIYSTSIWGNVEYAINLSRLASSIFSTTKNNIKIEIKAVDRYDYDKWKNEESTVSWLRNIFINFDHDANTMRQDFDVEITRGINGIGRGEDCVTIIRKYDMIYYQMAIQKKINIDQWTNLMKKSKFKTQIEMGKLSKMECKSLNGCGSLGRVIFMMKLYHRLCNESGYKMNKECGELMHEYLSDRGFKEYSLIQLINDCNHLMQYHQFGGDHIKSIIDINERNKMETMMREYFGHCDVMKCNIIQRILQRQDNEDNENKMSEIDVERDIVDKYHRVFFHPLN